MMGEERQGIETLWETARGEDGEALLSALAAFRAEHPGALEGPEGWRLHELYAAAFARTLDAEGGAQAYFRAMQADRYRSSQLRHFSNYLFALHYLSGPGPEEMLRQHLAYGRLLGEVPPAPSRGAALRVGFLAPDFSQSSVSLFSLPLIRALADYPVYLYDMGDGEAVEPGLSQVPHTYRPVGGLAPEEVADRIRADGIGVLFDLGGHSAGGVTLPVLAVRPAPVLLSGIGYFDTTGLPSFDGLLSDAEMDPPGTERFLAERPLRLPSMLCFAPREDMRRIVRAPRRPGPLRLGAFHNFLKLGEAALALYRAALEALPEATLLLHDVTREPGRVAALREKAEAAGLPVDRVVIRPGEATYLSWYQDIDILLDATPYPGGAMTAIALYMGVPVVTLAGTRRSERFGASILQAADCAEGIVSSPAEYVAAVQRLAADLGALNALQLDLRKKIERSSLMDEALYGRAVRAAIRALWEEKE